MTDERSLGPRAWLAVAAAGAVICTVCDHLHVVTGVLAYPHVAFWGEAWWVPLLFGAASVVIVANAGVLRRMFSAPPLPIPSARRVLAGGVAFVTAYAFTAFGHELPNVVAAVLAGFWLARALQAPAWLIAYSIATAVGGSAFEATWSALGFFRYLVPDFAGIPRWLPGIYLHVAFLTADLERLLGRGAE
ncbi:MAG TPA: hypothetical protein VF765_21650 [Polyangiaceae bacterium]